MINRFTKKYSKRSTKITLAILLFDCILWGFYSISHHISPIIQLPVAVIFVACARVIDRLD